MAGNDGVTGLQLLRTYEIKAGIYVYIFLFFQNVANSAVKPETIQLYLHSTSQRKILEADPEISKRGIHHSGFPNGRGGVSWELTFFM